MTGVKVYGADWCGETQHALAHLEELQVPFEYINVDNDERAAAWLRRQNDGKEKKPTFDIGGIIITNPTDKELDLALKENGLI